MNFNSLPTYYFVKLYNKTALNFTLEWGHESPGGVQRYSSTLSLTSALNGGGWLTPRPGLFAPGNDPAPIV